MLMDVTLVVMEGPMRSAGDPCSCERAISMITIFPVLKGSNRSLGCDDGDETVPRTMVKLHLYVSNAS